MGLPARRLDPGAPSFQGGGRTPPARWVHIDRAVAVTGIKRRAWQVRCTQLATRGLAAKHPPPGGVGRDVWWISPQADARLALAGETPADVDLSKYPQAAVETASRRLTWLRRWWELCRAHPGTSKRDLADRVAREVRAADPSARLSRGSMERWSIAYHRGGVESLIDGRHARTQSGRVGADVDANVGGPTRDPEAVEFFLTLYHSGRKSAALCHRVTLAEARRRDWRWPESAGGTARWWRQYGNRERDVLCREGEEAWRHRYMPYIHQRYDDLVPGDHYVTDHQQLNIFCRVKVGGRWVTVRPWLTSVQDMASRMIVGWHVGQSPHSDSIALAVRAAFTRFSVSRHMKIDNGRDYRSKRFTGVTRAGARALRAEHGPNWKRIAGLQGERVEINAAWPGLFAAVGCELHIAAPYEPQSKLVERFHRTINLQWAVAQPTHCDTAPHLKPDGLDDVLSGMTPSQARTYRRNLGRGWRKLVKSVLPHGPHVPTLDDVRRTFRDWLTVYHNTEHAGDGMGGRTPIQRWSETPKSLGVADPGALHLLCQVIGERKVTGKGVGVTIGGATVYYGRHNPDVMRFAGRNVLIAVDPDDVGAAVVMAADTRELIAVARANDRLPADTDQQELRNAIARNARLKREAKRVRESAADRLVTAAGLIRKHYAERADELRATGTDDERPALSTGDTMRLVQTGVEAASRTASTTIARANESRAEYAVADLIDQNRDHEGAASDYRESLPPTRSGGADSEVSYADVLDGMDAASGTTDDTEVEQDDLSITDLL